MTQELISHPELPPKLPGEYRPLIFSFPPGAPPPPPGNVYRWYSTPDFKVGDNAELSLGASSTAGDTVLVDRLLLIRTDNSYRLATDPLHSDTDGDEISDGGEAALNSYWYEAEHFALENGQIKLNVDASNGKEIVKEFAGARLCLVSNGTLYPAGRYQIYIRAGKAFQAAADLALRFSIQYAGQTVTGSVGLTDLYEWNIGILDDGKTVFELAEPSTRPSPHSTSISCPYGSPKVGVP